MEEVLKGYLFFYVTKGHCPGVYTNWEEANDQVINFTFPEYHGFNSYEEASMGFKSRMWCPYQQRKLPAVKCRLAFNIYSPHHHFHPLRVEGKDKGDDEDECNAMVRGLEALLDKCKLSLNAFLPS
ncbi:hypothetical protein PIB30_050277 [Stylosanthes scabra]|uniref:Ribonuclease H1 N-terminal domain-containing protein n=1 Tax=Stylosanthes scabra TaxID=79078 RepID=A0ABU6VGG1_9FABA|nr:hypothetical protein [Stylosanthes scabra]